MHFLRYCTNFIISSQKQFLIMFSARNILPTCSHFQICVLSKYHSGIQTNKREQGQGCWWDAVKSKISISKWYEEMQQPYKNMHYLDENNAFRQNFLAVSVLLGSAPSPKMYSIKHYSLFHFFLLKLLNLFIYITTYFIIINMLTGKQVNSTMWIWLMWKAMVI